VWETISVILCRWRGKPTKEAIERTNKVLASEPRVKVLGFYWTLGRYDAVMICEGPEDPKIAMKMLLQVADSVATESMVAIPREEAIKLLK